MEIEKLKKGDYILVKCKVEAVFSEGGMVAVSTRDCDEGFDAYVDEIYGIADNETFTQQR